MKIKLEPFRNEATQEIVQASFIILPTPQGLDGGPTPDFYRPPSGVFLMYLCNQLFLLSPTKLDVGTPVTRLSDGNRHTVNRDPLDYLRYNLTPTEGGYIDA